MFWSQLWALFLQTFPPQLFQHCDDEAREAMEKYEASIAAERPSKRLGSQAGSQMGSEIGSVAGESMATEAIDDEINQLKEMLGEDGANIEG